MCLVGGGVVCLTVLFIRFVYMFCLGGLVGSGGCVFGKVLHVFMN